jgi:bla regulator protein BlaR1
MHRIFLATALAGAVFAQKFEVASIKPNKSNDHRIMIGIQPGGRFNASNVTVKQLITMAYGIRDYQVSGLPSWAESDHYDIAAKPEGGDSSAPDAKTQQEKMRAMIKDLLADRFGMKTHSETKELPIYALVVAKNGPKMEESKENAPEAADGVPRGRGGQMIRMGRGQLSGQEMRMDMLVNQLSQILRRNVVDKTGLTGKYDIKLNWTPDPGEGGMMPGPSDGAPPPSADSGPSIFTAIQEQLGLKLDSQRGPVELVVVDKIERPSEN